MIGKDERVVAIGYEPFGDVQKAVNRLVGLLSRDRDLRQQIADNHGVELDTVDGWLTQARRAQDAINESEWLHDVNDRRSR